MVRRLLFFLQPAADFPAKRRLGAGSCVKILLPRTEPQGFVGRGEQKAKAAGRPEG